MSSQAARVALRGVRDPGAGSEGFRADLRSGLAQRPPRIPPKYFYDDRGALLFEEITRSAEYYLTRTELAILEENLSEIAHAVGPRARVVELGSGSGRKTQLLLEQLEDPISYVPVDIACGQLEQLAASVRRSFPSLDVAPICADYTRGWHVPTPGPSIRRTLAFFPGSTIGNFEPAEAPAFLRTLHARCAPGDMLLIGVDLHKDRTTIERAYNDAHGVTAAFNLNLLHRIRECGGTADPDAFRHRAFYDDDKRRIEMRLVCERSTEIIVPADRDGDPPLVFAFRPRDWIHTEFSHKYTLADFEALTGSAGWSVHARWTDAREWFAVWLLERAA